jgi:hypothetical protein
MSTLETIAHEIIAERGIPCVVKDCGCTQVELSHIIAQNKVNIGYLGLSIDILGLNVLPMCKQHHTEKHSGNPYQELDAAIVAECYAVGREQLARYLCDKSRKVCRFGVWAE